MPRALRIDDRFIRGLKSLPPLRKEQAKKALEKFLREPMPPGLCFRPLAGLAGHFIVDANAGDRIILRLVEEEIYEALDVGPHDNIYRRWNR